jgi:nickel superoxide dismutase
MLKFLLNILPTTSAYAHCDVPCGIYDPKPAQIAAATVLKMAQKIDDLYKSDAQDAEAHNSMTRFIWTKEEHARKCKEELLILWTDFFKPEHLERFPDLHSKFWSAAKLCSKVKQTVDIGTAEDLTKAVDEIADMFAKSKAS